MRDFDWMPPPDAGVADSAQAGEAAPSDAAADDEPAAADEAESRKSFYGGLSQDFDQAAQGSRAGRRDGPPDQPPPEDRMRPREDDRQEAPQ